MYLEIVSPERTLFNGDVESVLVPGTDGSFQMLDRRVLFGSLPGPPGGRGCRRPTAPSP